LLLFFASLFVVVHSVEKAGLLVGMNQVNISAESLRGLAILHSLSLFMSQIVSNVPYAIAVLPMMKSLDNQTLWLALASSATLAGNATIIGAVANLIVIESAGRLGVRISFLEFLKPGLIATLISLVISVLVLHLQSVAGLL
jgi:Na+/H+ antiporter NhaD/arsenite permease-like protein